MLGLISVAVFLLLPLQGQSVPLGDEIQVNTTTERNQVWPDVAMHSDGSFVVAFENHLAVTNGNVSAQRFDALGNRVGIEFLVNGTANTDVTRPAIDMDANGNFVIAWQDFGDDGSGPGIFAQRYNAIGVAQGAMIPVNTTTNDGQRHADIAVDDNGNFLIAWEDDTLGNAKRGIRGQLFNANGVAQGGEIDISTDADIDHSFPRVAHDGAGNFVVGWAAGDGGANKDVLFRRYNSAGVAQGIPVQVNVLTKLAHASGTNNNMSVGMDQLGNIFIVWRADNDTGPGIPGQNLGIYLRRYDNTGAPLGDAFVADSDTGADLPEISVTAGGAFAVSYQASDGSLMGIWVKQFHADGQPKGVFFLNNTTTTLVQDHSAIAIDGSNRGVVVWRSKVDAQDGDGDSVWARIFRLQAAELIDMPDTNSSGSAELAALRVRQSDGRGRVQLKERDGTAVRTSLFSSGYTAINVLQINDTNANGIPEFAVVQQRLSDNRCLVQIRDALTKTVLNNVWFSNGYTPLLSTKLDDINGNGSEEIVVLLRRQSDHRIVLQIRDSATKAPLRNIWLPATLWVIDLVVVPDTNGNGADDIALLMVKKSSGRNSIQVRDPVSGLLLVNITHPTSVTAQNIAVTSDVNGGGAAELVTLVRRLSNDAVGVRLNDSVTGASISRIWYRPAVSVVSPQPLVTVGDTDGNGFGEIVVLMRRTLDQRFVIQSRDASTGALLTDILLAPGYTAETMVNLPAFGGNADGLGLLGFSGGLISQVRVHDADTGAQLLRTFFPLP